MKTPDQWLNPPGPNGVKWVADIQIDAREGMVPAAELQAVEKERDRCKRLLESFKAFVSVTPVNPLNTWLEERDKLISNSECRVCSTCGGLLGSHYAGTPCSCIQALQPAQKESQ